MGKSNKTKVGYHYRLALHIGLMRGSIDAFVEFRAADKTAWSGELTASGRIQINAPQLFGGEKDQGGIVGPVDVMFGEEDQMPNAYLVGLGRTQTAAWRGFSTLVFAGGRYGAMSPFGQKPSFKVRKILQGWDGDYGEDPCWYPEKAPVLMSTGDLAFFAARTSGSVGQLRAGPTPYDMTTQIDTGLATVFRLKAAGGALFAFGTGNAGRVSFDRGTTFEDVAGLPSGVSVRDLKFDGGVWLASVESGLYAYRSTDARNFSAVQLTDTVRSWYQVHVRNGTWTIGSTNNLYARSINQGVTWAMNAVTDSDGIGIFNAAGAAAAAVVPVPGGWLALGGTGYIGFSSSGTTHTYERVTSPINAYIGTESAMVVDGKVLMIKAEKTAVANTIPGAISVIGDLPTVHNGSDNVAMANGVVLAGTNSGMAILLGDSWESIPLPEWAGGYHVAALPTGAGAVVGMNAAHALYYVRTDESKGRQPRESMDDANLAAAADRLYAEGFGLCWTYDPERDTPDSFDEQVCRIIDGGWARSLHDGKWRLHLNRADYDFGSLPIMSDGDGAGPGLILSFRELPSTLDTAVNILGVRYFDIARKEAVTVWARAPGLVRQFGEIRQILEMPWIPSGTLAARVADRELRSYITPKRSFEISTDPRYRFIDRYQTIRLQTPKRGIADMVCVVGEKEAGTLRSGAIRWVLTQHVTSFSDAIIVEPEYGVDTRPPQVPVAIEHALVFEAPYIDVCATLPRAELEVLPEDVGYLIGVAADPGRHLDYTMMVQPDGGEYSAAATGDWCATALVVEAATDDPEEIDFTLSDATGLALVQVGSPVIWGPEWCRVDDLDVDADPPTIRLGRGCADTLAHEHDAGDRLWFIGDRVAADTTEYTDGETANVKMLSNTGSALLPLDSAAALPVALAGRQARPYPPAHVLLNGEHRPPIILGDLLVSWRHRDRVGQADQLFDQSVASIGPEPGTTYTVEIYDVDSDTLIYSEDEITGDEASIDAGDMVFSNRVELFAVRDGIESWQRFVAFFQQGFEILGAFEKHGYVAGETDSIAFTAPGAAAPLTWSIDSGSPPDGWTLDPDTGVLGGRADDDIGTYTFVVKCVDDNEIETSKEFSVRIGHMSLLMHMDGTDGSTTFTDETGKTITRNGNTAEIDTAQSKFGGASGLFGGNSGFVSAPGGPDFQFGTGPFTISSWLRPASVPSSTFYSPWGNWASGVPGTFCMFLRPSRLLSVNTVDSPTPTAVDLAPSAPNLWPTAGTWFHIELSRDEAGTARIFVDGALVYQQAAWTPNLDSANNLRIGHNGVAGDQFPGHIDEMRVVKGVAEHVEDFTPPAAPSNYTAT